ncbi:MAG TPA: NAD(P)-binding protein [Gemmatimonadaceae bacterium]|jgi:2-oxoacid:acceptor oxidoreductase delta subunit (pyruvate/2-ketoisovalerate family)
MTTTPGPHAVPQVAMSSTSTLVTRTGSWKYQMPAYHDRVAPCNARCPVGIDIEGYMNLLREGRVDEARDLLLTENPLPAVTGRVCHHPCENACNRHALDGAVAIHAVERMLGDLAHQRPAPVVRGTPRAERVAVVGSGPAGLACGYHLARLGYGVTIFESADAAGGMLRLGIPEYRLRRDVLDRDIARVAAHGVEIKCGVRVGTDIAWSELTKSFNAVCISTGAHTSRALGVPGEDLAGVRPGLAFLREVNSGKRPALGQRVLVVGGGNTAMDCARSAMRLGAKVTVAYRRTREQMPAIKEEIEDAMREGAEFVFLANPLSFNETNGRVSAMVCERMALGEPDASGRRRPVPTGEQFTLEADTVLTAIGESSALQNFFPDVEGSDSGLRVDALGGTTRDLLYASGDVTDLERTVADALGAGKRAAIGIDRHLRHHHGDTAELNALRFAEGNLSAARWSGRDPIRRTAPLNTVVKPDDLNFTQFRRVERHADPHLPSDLAAQGFDEVNAGLSAADAMDEAQRCLNCGVCTECDVCLIFCPDAAITHAEGGAYVVAMDYCKGCGICAAECPRGAITMTQDRP